MELFLNETVEVPALPGAAEALPEPAEDKELNCPICMQLLNDTFLTVCGHSFCYTCIVTHLQNKSDCPCCAHFLTTSLLFPNFLLDKLVKERSAARQLSKAASPAKRFRRSLEQGCDVTVEELDSLLSLMLERKGKMEQGTTEEKIQKLLNFLNGVNEGKSNDLNEIQNDLLHIKQDASVVQRCVFALHRAEERISPMPKLVSVDPIGHRPHTSMDTNVPGFMYNSYNAQREVASVNFQHEKDVESVQVNLVGTQSTDASFIGPISQHTTHSLLFFLQKQRAHDQFNELQQVYLRNKRQLVDHSENHEKKGKTVITREGYSPGLDDFQSVLSTCTRYGQLEVLAEIGHKDIFHSADVVSSIEFDRDDELFATAGVSKRIKVFDFTSVVNEPTGVHCPVVEIATRSKLSCLSWNKFSKYHMASSDYEGTVTFWDVNTQKSIMDYDEHMRRAWSVDFSRTEPSMLVSGSDDCTVKVWSTNQEASVLDIDMMSNVCSVKYNPDSSNFIAELNILRDLIIGLKSVPQAAEATRIQKALIFALFTPGALSVPFPRVLDLRKVGSADRNVYYYDLRKPCHPLYVLRGHKKAVSYVRFLSNNELASASTDSTLRLWDVNQNLHIQSFTGHKNERNFVGLTVSNDFLACGSEENCVVVYHKAISKPMVRHTFGSSDDEEEEDDEEEDARLHFISAVCWKSDGTTMLAANSEGTIRALVLAP